MDEDGWVASDATKYKFHDQRPNWISLAAVAVAVDDIEEFNEEYFDIIKKKSEKYGIQTQHPIIKDEDITRWVTDWERSKARREIVTELFAIDTLREIQFVETSLSPQWVTIFEENEDNKKRVNSQKFMNNYLEKYYNVVAIWEYLRKKKTRPEHLPFQQWPIHKNVMTDDFGGQISETWLDVGDLADQIEVIPQGDKTYPLLSLADLTMDMVKQQVENWDVQEIYELLKEITPEESAWVDSKAISHGDDLQKMVPHTTDSIRSIQHYPSPTVYLDSGNRFKSKKVKSLDFFDDACKYAQENGGCVKFFNESHDRDFMSSSDILVALDESKLSNLRDYEEMNDKKSVTVLTQKEASERFTEELSI
ncbi:hypothetical protein JT689_01630 (plasmid) [Halobacterium sp. GSL-19]|uniref:hypothetical protein n=1 Tax=Halobacterium sp. GSL-19 TaxID=2812551 RepID=UPI00196359E2|nr:hypothetical protein [Halobacterium sp. GSL-19]QRY21734.1 hypothetical protein JT689_01630 [Halobacterium sp. GSL-19]